MTLQEARDAYTLPNLRASVLSNLVVGVAAVWGLILWAWAAAVGP